jgi:hypothetical protein
VKVYTLPCLAPASQIIKAIGIIRSKLCDDGTKVVKRRRIDKGQAELFGEGTRYLCGEFGSYNNHNHNNKFCF